MRIIEQIAESEMVATFLRAEINSLRFGASILLILERDGVERKIIDEPDENNAAENEYRDWLLGELRGYKRNEELFDSFPNDIEWYRILLNRADFLQIKHMNYSYWIDLSGGSRLVADAVKRLAAGEIEKATARWIRAAANSVEQGVLFPEIILVGQNRRSDLIILEGHLRATGYLASLDYLPPELSAIVGYSEKIAEWDVE